MAYLFRLPQQKLFVIVKSVARARKLLVMGKRKVADGSPS